ncbi:AraC family transcriptional regulator [Clostridiaceae bacterium M8S5]|nr:AraC family transcriptional regulator [Clostridiaceae bacterium M8S5]
MGIQREMYESCMFENGFFKNDDNHELSDEWTCYSLLPEFGEGNYWVYFCEDLFSISIMDFCYYEDLILELNQPDYISICYYESVSGEELYPYKRLSSSYIKSNIGKGKYKALYHKNIPIRCIGILIMPKYYEDYLKSKYPNEYENPLNAFASVNGSTNFPELVFLLNQIKNYKLNGIAAKLYYESKVAETISIIVQKTKKIKPIYTSKSISNEDMESLRSVTSYIDDHFGYNIHLDHLAKIACMGKTKLKYTFKKAHKCTVHEYILNKRMSQAEHLLTNTNLSISQIAQVVGYKKASNFSEIFRKNTGILPSKYRNLSLVTKLPSS